MSRPPKRWLLPGVGGGLFVLLLVLTPGIWLGLNSFVLHQRDLVWDRLETLLGQKIVYDRIAPDVLSALDFQNVRLLADDGTPVLTAASVRLSLDWLALFSGRFDKVLKRLQVINGSVTIDERRDRAMLSRWANFFQKSSSEEGGSLGFELEAFNLTARWTDGPRFLSLDRGFAVLVPADSRWTLRYRGAVSWEDRSRGPAWASVSIRGDLQADAGFQNLSLRTEASQLRTAWFDLEPVTVQISVSPQEVVISKVADRIPLDLQATLDQPTGTWSFRGVSERFVPGGWLKLKSRSQWTSLVEGEFSGKLLYTVGGDFSFTGRGGWPAGVLPSPLDQGGVSAIGSIRSEGGLFLFDDMALEADRVSLAFTGTVDPESFLPDGRLEVKKFQVPGVGKATAVIDLMRSAGGVDLEVASLGWNNWNTSALTGRIGRQRDGNWEFAFQGPWDPEKNGTFSVSGTTGAGFKLVTLDASVSELPMVLLKPELQRWMPGNNLPPEVWDLVANARASLSWAPGDFRVSKSSFSIQDPKQDSRRVEGTFVWQGSSLLLDLTRVDWEGFHGSANLTALFEAKGTIGWALDARAWDRDFRLEGRWVGQDRTLAFTGTPQVSGFLHQNDAGFWSFHIDTEAFPLWQGWKLTLGLNGQWERQGWQLSSDLVQLSGIYPWNQQPFSVKATLLATPDVIKLPQLEVSDGAGKLAGSLATSWSMDFSRPWSGNLAVLTPLSAREDIAATWSVSAVDRWQWEATISGFDLSRAGIPNLQGRLAVSAKGESGSKGLTWTAQTSVSEARFGDAPLGFRALFSGADGQVSLRNGNLSVSPVRVSDAQLDWDTTKQAWNGVLGIGIRIGSTDWDSTWQLSGQGPDDTRSGWKVALATKDNRWAKKSVADWTLVGSWREGAWNAALSDGSLAGEGDSEGRFSLKALAPFPLHAEISGKWADSKITAKVQRFEADLSLLKDLINTKLFSITGGVARGSFNLEGSLTDPELFGSVGLQGLTATSSFVRRPIGPVDIPVVLEGHRLKVDSVNVGPAGQTWMVSGGARLDHFVPEEFLFQVQTDLLSTIPASYQYTGISATGGASGLFLIKGSPNSLTLGGKLTVQDTTITLKPTQGEASGGGDALGFNVDLTLVTGRKVEFLWPNETLPLLRAVTTSNQVLVIKSNDVASTWSVTGKMALRTGEINYLNRTFVLKEGQLTFQESEAGFDPRIGVRAEWKIREPTGNILINLIAEGPLSRFSPRFDATPYKSPDELQQLVGTTLALPTDYTKATSVETALSVASDVGTSFLLTPFEETVKKNFNLDLFTVKTEILKKSLLNRNGPLEASDYLDNTRLFFGKYIGDDLFLQGTLAFRRDTSVAAQVSPKMLVEPELQMEFQTPFFLFNWTLLPQHPETLFVADNTVTFRWNWSY